VFSEYFDQILRHDLPHFMGRRSPDIFREGVPPLLTPLNQGISGLMKKLRHRGRSVEMKKHFQNLTLSNVGCGPTFFQTLRRAGVGMAGVTVLGVALSCSLLAQTSAGSGQPGLVDPVGGKLTMFRDDSVVSFSPDAPNNGINLRFYRTDLDTTLSLEHADGFSARWSNFPLTVPTPISAAAGRVIGVDLDTVVMARRLPGTAQLQVRALDAAANYIEWISPPSMAQGPSWTAVATG
jgi:hypothetical protein